jgi:tetratricopeptide (TPR) repeat protein
MYDRHASSAELAQLAYPAASIAQTRATAEHLFSCGECWRNASSVLHSLMTSQEIQDVDPSLRALLERFSLEQEHLEERLLAQAMVGELREVNSRSRRERLTRHRGRRTRAVIEELLSESRSAAPIEGEEWANLAVLVCHQLPAEEFSDEARADLLAEAFTELASSRRRGARWNSARAALNLGHEHAKRGTGNPSVEGLLLAVEGAIEGDLGELQKAEIVLLRARTDFEIAGERRLTARTIVQLAYILMDAEPSKSLKLLNHGEGIIPEQDKRLYLLAEATRIDCLITLGDSAQALRRFADLADLWDQFADPFFQLRRRFMAGRLLEGLGKYSEADALFQQVIAVDLEQRSTKSLFLDLVYLFGSYARRGDFNKAMEVCRQAIRDLSALEIESESKHQMKALWNSLGREAQAGKVGRELLLKSRLFIRNQWRTAGENTLSIKESAI